MPGKKDKKTRLGYDPKADLLIAGHSFLPGASSSVNIKIAELPTHTEVSLKVYVFRSLKPGPVLLLTAGLHGDEINGIEIVRQLLAAGNLMPECGTVIAIPLVNVYGFLNQTRHLPDGKDLNRSFPGSEQGSLANRIAFALSQHIIPLIDYGVDFHTGGASRTNYPQVRCTFNNPQNISLAAAFGAPMTLNSGLIDKSFRKEAFRQGKYVIVYEGGESLRIDRFAIQEGKEGVLRLMHHLKMRNAKDSPPKRSSAILPKTSWMRARKAGMFQSLFDYGANISKNQIIGRISDPYGETEYLVKSPRKAYIAGVNFAPVINAGDALFHLAYEE